MTVKEANKIVESFPPEFNSSALPDYFYAAKSFLDYHKRVQPVIEALRSIANEDYRGNRSPSSVAAFKALAQYEKDVIGEWEGK